MATSTIRVAVVVPGVKKSMKSASTPAPRRYRTPSIAMTFVWWGPIEELNGNLNAKSVMIPPRSIRPVRGSAEYAFASEM